MFNLTSEQLEYIIRRRFPQLKIGSDVLIIERLDVEVPESWIAEWNSKDISEPSDQEIMNYWIKLEKQYNADPEMEGSKINKFLKDRKCS